MKNSVAEDFRWMLGGSAKELLDETLAAFDDRQPVLKTAKRLRKKTTKTRAALIVEQAQLRIRGRTKFDLADQMFFTRRGLEQSSGLDIALYKASKFCPFARVADVCCGLGGDLIALNDRTSDLADESLVTVGVDADEVTSLFAARNLDVYRQHAQPSSRRQWVQHVTFEQLNLSEFDALHIDPDRRTERRTVRGDQFSPSLNEVYDRVGDHQAIGIKVAPATPIGDYIPSDIHREWIGDRRECKQQIFWSGAFQNSMAKQFGSRTATMVDNGQACSFSAIESEVAQRCEFSDGVMEYLYEPHPAVRAAHLTDAIARAYGLVRAADGIAYLFGDAYVRHPLLSAFKVLDVTRLSVKDLNASLERLDIGLLEFKRRGIDKMTAGKFSKLKGPGGQPATLILTRIGTSNKRKAILARRLVSEDSDTISIS
ncbi:MAG: hypothetical protein AAFN77_04730 [Planctomycetota bacterium]